MSIIPKWADDEAKRVLDIFPTGDTGHIDRELTHGAIAAALVKERERCRSIAMKVATEAGSYPTEVTGYGPSWLAEKAAAHRIADAIGR